ncbi:hypothetical protein [Miltoncostaea oceani]|uniref:hypothetical protein n=1 Tax=Miltoncostaea oceani TaxID=2843216 RepID=UPI001C3C9674|nr:hypothetical protein [Miltoncostaea oceani]
MGIFGKARNRIQLVQSLERAAQTVEYSRAVEALDNEELLWATYLFHRFKHRGAEYEGATEVERRKRDPSLMDDLQDLNEEYQALRLSDWQALEGPLSARILAKLDPAAGPAG